MARVTYVKKAQQRYAQVPVLDAEGNQVKVPVMARNGEQKVTKKGKPVFQRQTVSDKTRPLPNHSCEKCGKEITVGSPYKWIKPKSGPYGGRMRIRCQECPNWRPSETTSSNALSILYAAQEAADDAIGGWSRNDADELRQILQELAEGVREAASTYEESAQAIEDGFGHATYVSEELQEKASTLEGQADDLENLDLDDWDEDSARSDAEDEVLDEYLTEIGLPPMTYEEALSYESADDEGEFDDAEFQRLVEEKVEEKREEWAQEQEDAATSAMGEVGI